MDVHTSDTGHRTRVERTIIFFYYETIKRNPKKKTCVSVGLMKD